ncbi:HNH endonuclease [Rossellomorea sp. H39__3]
MEDFDWDCEGYHLFSTTNIVNRVNGDKLFVLFLRAAEDQQKDVSASYRIGEIAELIPKETSGIIKHATYGYSFMTMISNQNHRDYFLFEDKKIQDELTLLCRATNRDNYYWKKHCINERVRVNPKYIKKRSTGTPISIMKNSQPLYEADSIQDAARYLSEHLNISIYRCYDPIERGYAYHVPYYYDGDIYRFIAPPEISSARRQQLEEKEHKNARRIWLVPANPDEYDLERAFSHFQALDWKRSYNYETGDILFLYVSGSVKKVKYKVEVIDGFVHSNDTLYDQSFWLDTDKYSQAIRGEKTRIRLVDVADKDELTLPRLRERGLRGNIQGSMKLTGELRDYIMSHFTKDVSSLTYPDDLPDLWEGERKTITVNAYERNPIARQQCINHYGVECQVCRINFEETYGEVGRDFIHVHHITPLHKVKEGYVVDPRTDLIPVCPNCHAMLHRKENGKYLTLEGLKGRFKV